MAQPPNTPIVNAGLLYVNGLAIGIPTIPTQQLILTAGSARDSTNTNDLILSADTTLSGSFVGVNGVDLAPFVAAELYAVYVIGDSTDYRPTAGLFSLNSNTPTLPFGYDMYRRVGYVLTNPSDTNIIPFYQYAAQNQRRDYWFITPIQILAGGTALNWTKVDIAHLTDHATEVTLQVLFTAGAGGDVAQFAPILPIPIPLSQPPSVSFGGYPGTQQGQVVVPTGFDGTVTPAEIGFYYKVTAAGDSVTVSLSSFVDYLAISG